MLHSISSSHFPTHRNCKRNACRLSLIACNLSHKNCTHKCVYVSVCVCCLKSFIAELCIFLLHSSCINSGIIALYDQQLPPAAASPPLLFSAWLLIGKSSLQVPGDCSKATHKHILTGRQTNRQTDGQADRLCICICGSSAEGLDFCMPWLSQRLTEKVLQPGQGRSCT